MIGRSENILRNYTIIGFLFGLTFPILGIISDCFIFNSVEVSFEGIIGQVFKNPIHFIILLAPIILAATFLIIGYSIKRQDQLNTKLARLNNSMKNTNELLDTFNYHVSHDLKTVLNNQLILSKMMIKYVEKEDLEKIKEIGSKLLVSGENGLDTVMSFLKISKEGFMAENEFEGRFNVVDEVNRIAAENNLNEKIKVQINIREFETLNIGNKVFESIVLNVLTNAIKYNNSESPHLLIDFKKSGNTKFIYFKDNGIGIDLEKNGDRLFQPFNRIENKKNAEGTGVGLFLIKKMLNSIGGEIDVKSELGQGTQFIITVHEMK